MQKKVYIHNLGCPKNEVDGQYYSGLIKNEEGFELVDDYSISDIIIINTCGFINSAKEESIKAIWEAVELKNENICEAVIVAGCLSQRYHDELSQDIPEIDGIFGVGDYKNIISLLESVKEGDRKKIIADSHQSINQRLPRRPDDNSYAYLKIADGCNKNCTYCAIPSIKGPYQSRNMDLILEEAEELISQGFSELILIAQDTTLYGMDIYGEPRLNNLIQELLDLGGNSWIRLMYTYLEHIEEELLQYISSQKRLCSYLDLPIQHSVEAVRRKMKRPGDESYLREKISKIRNIVPGISLRTALMVGFPGETEDDFARLKKFVGEMKFDRLGVFKYSREEGTKAANLSGQISEEVKKQRYNEIMRIQQEISLEKNQEKVGEKCSVIIDSIREGEFRGRTEADAPEIDNEVHGSLPRRSSIEEGDIVTCKIRAASEYDLMGEIINEPGQ